MARNRTARYSGYYPVPSPGSPDTISNHSGANSSALRETRPRGKLADDALSPRKFSLAFRSFRAWKLWLIFFATFHIFAAPGFAQASKEYQLKAVFLWRLAQFTEWPANAFEHGDSPIVICVLGENPFGDALDAAVRGESAHGRKFLTQYHRGIEQLKTCHVLYLTGAGPRQAKAIAAAVDGKSVLTVRDIDGLASAYETIIGLVTEQNKIKLRINLKAASAARLVLDPRLLRAAEIVGNE
jgi:hypothetical protein